MSDEIKEILNRLEKIGFYASVPKELAYMTTNIAPQECKAILDYITNLQQENEKLKKLEYKFFYCSEDEESFTLEDYLELGNKVYDLEQENKKLKDRYERCKKQKIKVENACSNYKYKLDKAEDEIDQLNSIIDETRRILGEYKHYSTPDEIQNMFNEEIVDKAYIKLHSNLGDLKKEQ